MSEERRLTNKQQAFITEYLKDFNGTQAAIRAGYSPKTAQEIASQNLSKLIIQDEIKRLVAEKSMGADEVIVRLAQHARGDMGDFLDITSMGFVIDLDSAKQKGLTHLIKKVKMRTQTTLNKDGTETETHDTEIELYDAQSALVQLGRFHKLFTDKTEVTGKDGEPLKVVIEYVDDPAKTA